MNESEFTREVTRELKRVRATVFTFVAGQHGQTDGIPDRYISHVLWQGFAEFKGQRTPISPMQKIHHDELNRQRIGQAIIVRFDSTVKDGFRYSIAIKDQFILLRWDRASKRNGIELLETVNLLANRMG